MLHRLLDYQDYLSIFGMVVRQFRLLVQTREILDEGGGKADMMQRLTKSAYLGDKLIAQARKFSLDDLKRIYHKLLDIDEAHKTSQMPGELALEMLVTALAIN
jgi:DNA polymerase-3 subunit delta